MKLRTLVYLVALPVVTGLMGCGGGEAPDAEGTSASSNQAAVSAPAGSATVQGTVTFAGTAPQRQQLNLARECAELHGEPVLAENVVVNDNGTLRYVFVYVKEGAEEYTFPTPTEPVVLDQEGCMYTPHVFGMQAGQPIRILNSDPLLHNIHAMPEENRPFNFGMPNEGDEREQSFREPEVMVRIKCDVHPWMLAWAGVLPHPFFSTTGEDGSFSIGDLPAGDYVIEAWHEQYGTQTQNVTVADGEEVMVDFTFGEGA